MTGFQKTLDRPALSPRRWLKFFYPYRRLRFTREGWIFSILALSIGLIAVNTGHNLFYLVFGLLLGMVIVSGLLSERVLRGIAVTRHLPPEVTARIPFATVLEVRNAHERKISYSLTIRDSGDFFPPRTLGYIPCLRPGESRAFHYLAQADRRGSYRLGPTQLVTRFPFGLFEKTRIVPYFQSLVVFPGQRPTPAIRSLVSGRKQIGNRKWRWGDEIMGLRPAGTEDDHRMIHWRTSARQGQLMVKEFVEEIEQPRPLFFDNRGREGEDFEAAVEVAATLVRELVGLGVPVSFSTWEEHVGAGAGESHLEASLRLLALISPSPACNTQGFEKWQKEVVREGGGIYLHGAAVTPASLPPCQVVRV